MYFLNLLLEFTRDDVGKYFKFAMCVGTKPHRRSDSIFVYDTQGAELLVFTILIPVRW